MGKLTKTIETGALMKCLLCAIYEVLACVTWDPDHLQELSTAAEASVFEPKLFRFVKPPTVS